MELLIALLLLAVFIIWVLYLRMKLAETWERNYTDMYCKLERTAHDSAKIIERMKVWQKNQEDREKQLLERIKFLEANQK